MTLKYKVVAITGAGSGIGRALALRCLEQGAYVAASDISAESLASLAEEAKPRELTFLSTRVDVADAQAVQDWAREAFDYFGYVDAVINNAGVSLSCNAAQMPRSQMEWLFDINFWGVVNGTEAFLPYLKQQPRAHIVNVSSVFGLIAMPSQSAYNAAKFAVRGYSESLRQDLADTGIRVTTVHPGGVKTNIARNGRHFHSMTGEATTVDEASRQFDQVAGTSPERAAEIILAGMLKGRRRILIGNDARLLDWIQRLLPASYDRLLRPFLKMGSRRALRQA